MAFGFRDFQWHTLTAPVRHFLWVSRETAGTNKYDQRFQTILYTIWFLEWMLLNYSHLNRQILMKGLFRLDGAVQSKQQQHLRCSLDCERLSSLTGTRCRQPVWRCPSEQERKELLITLLTTGGRHTQGFLWGHSASAYGHWVCQQGPQDRLGIWLSPLVLIGFTVITVRWACDITPKPISTTPTIPRIWDINKQGKDVGRGGYSSLSCFFFSSVGDKQVCVSTLTQYFSTQAELWGEAWYWLQPRMTVCFKGPLWRV